MIYVLALLVFILCNLIKIMALLPCFGSWKMKRLMRAYRRCSSATEGIVEYLLCIPLCYTDLRFLLDRLATNYGVGHAMAAMTLFDTVI